MKKFILIATTFMLIFGIFINAKPEYKLFIGLRGIGQSFEYISSDGGFEATELLGKGLDIETINNLFEKYHADHPDAVLMRKFPKNYLKFWHWREYWTHNRWKLPYYSAE